MLLLHVFRLQRGIEADAAVVNRDYLKSLLELLLIASADGLCSRRSIAARFSPRRSATRGGRKVRQTAHYCDENSSRIGRCRAPIPLSLAKDGAQHAFEADLNA